MIPTGIEKNLLKLTHAGRYVARGPGKRSRLGPDPLVLLRQSIGRAGINARGCKEHETKNRRNPLQIHEPRPKVELPHAATEKGRYFLI